MAIVAKVSSAGSDVGTAANTDLRLTTELPILKVSNSDTFSLTIPSGSSNAVFGTLSHSLGYRPISVITMEHSVGANVRRVATVFGVAGGAGDDLDVDFATGTSSVVVRATPLGTSGSDRTYKGFYYIFYDPQESLN